MKTEGTVNGNQGHHHSLFWLEYSCYQTQVLPSFLALNSHTGAANANITIHSHHLVTQLMLRDLVTRALIRVGSGNFIRYGENISFHTGDTSSSTKSKHPVPFFHTRSSCLPLTEQSLAHRPPVSGRALRYDHSKCPPAPDTRGSLLWASQIHSHVWA